MHNSLDKLTPADPADLADALAFALCYQGRKRPWTSQASSRSHGSCA